MARCQVSWSTPGGGPAAGPGAAGTPCSLKQCAQPPWPVGATELDDCSGGGVFAEHARTHSRRGQYRGQRSRPH